MAIGPLLMLFVCVTGCGTKITPQLHSFESDGCSSFPDGTASEPVLWRDDCVVHDYAYWKGGTWKERRDADRELRDGIRRK
ncbi:MAG: FAD-binding oxidoreductase, partial [Akkermansiaceae bacterium]